MIKKERQVKSYPRVINCQSGAVFKLQSQIILTYRQLDQIIRFRLIKNNQTNRRCLSFPLVITEKNKNIHQKFLRDLRGTSKPKFQRNFSQDKARQRSFLYGQLELLQLPTGVLKQRQTSKLTFSSNLPVKYTMLSNTAETISKVASLLLFSLQGRRLIFHRKKINLN